MFSAVGELLFGTATSSAVPGNKMSSGGRRSMSPAPSPAARSTRSSGSPEAVAETPPVIEHPKKKSKLTTGKKAVQSRSMDSPAGIIPATAVKLSVSTRSAGTPDVIPASTPATSTRRQTGNNRVAASSSKAKSKKEPAARGSSPVKSLEEEGGVGKIVFNDIAVDDMMYVDLKAALRDLGISYAGKKAELAERLKEHLQASAVASPITHEADRKRSTRLTRTPATVYSPPASPVQAPAPSTKKKETVSKRAAIAVNTPAVESPDSKIKSSRKRKPTAEDEEEEEIQQAVKGGKSTSAKPVKSVRIAVADDDTTSEASPVAFQPPKKKATFAAVTEIDSPAKSVQKVEENEAAEIVPEKSTNEPVQSTAVVLVPAAAPTPGADDFVNILIAKFTNSLKGGPSLSDQEYSVVQYLLKQQRGAGAMDIDDDKRPLRDAPRASQGVRFAPEVPAYEDAPRSHVHFGGIPSAIKQRPGSYDTAPTPMPDRSYINSAVEVNVRNAGVTPFGKPVSAQRFAGHTPFVSRPAEPEDSNESPPVSTWSQSASNAASTPLRVPPSYAGSYSGDYSNRTDSYGMQVDSDEKNQAYPADAPSPVPMGGRWSNGSRDSAGGRNSYGLWQGNNWRQTVNPDSASLNRKRDPETAELDADGTFVDSEFPAAKRPHVSFDSHGSDRRYISMTEPKKLRYSMGGSVAPPAAYTPSFKVNAASVSRTAAEIDSMGQPKLYPFNSASSGASPMWNAGRSNFSSSTPMSVKSRAQMLTASASRRKLIRSRLEAGAASENVAEGNTSFNFQAVPTASAVVAKRILETLGEMVTPMEEERQRHPVSKLYKSSSEDKKEEQPKNVETKSLEDKKPAFSVLFADPGKISVAPEKPAAVETKKAASYGLSGRDDAGKKVAFSSEKDSKSEPVNNMNTAKDTSMNSSEFSFGNPVPVSGIDEDIAAPEAVNLARRLSGAGNVKDEKIKFVFSPPLKGPKRQPAKKAPTGDKTPASKPVESAPTLSVPAASTTETKDKSAAPVATAPAAPSIWNMASTKIKCDVCYAQNEKDASKCVCCENPLSSGGASKPKEAAVAAPAASTPSFSFAAPKTAPASNPASFSGGFTFGSIAPETKVPETKTPEAPVSGFTFSAPSFGATSAKSDSQKKEDSEKASKSEPSPAATPVSSGFSFSAPAAASLLSTAASTPVFGGFGGFSSSAKPAEKLEKRESDANEDDGNDEPLNKKRGFDTEPSSAPSTGGFSFPTTKPSTEGAPAFKFSSTAVSETSVEAPAKPATAFSFSSFAAPAKTDTITAPVEPAKSTPSFSFSGANSVVVPAGAPAAAPPVSGPFSFTSSSATLVPSSETPKPFTFGAVGGSATGSDTAGSTASIPFTFGGQSKPAEVANKSETDATKASVPIPFTFGGSSANKSGGSIPFTFGAIEGAPTLGASSSTSLTGGSLTGGALSNASGATAGVPFTFGAASSTTAPKDSAPSTASPFVFGAPTINARATPPSSIGGVSSMSPSGMDYSSGGENSNFAAPQASVSSMFGAPSVPIAGIGMPQNSSAPMFGAPSAAAPFSAGGFPSFGSSNAFPGNSNSTGFGSSGGLNSAGGSSNSLSSTPVFGGSTGGANSSAAPFTFGNAPPAAPQLQQGFNPSGGGMMGGNMNWGAINSSAAAPSGGSSFSMGSINNSNQPGSTGTRRKLKAKRGGNN